MRVTFGLGDIEALSRARAAKTPGWRHRTRVRPDKHKSKKAMKVKAQRAVERNRKLRDYAAKRVEQGSWIEAPRKQRRAVGDSSSQRANSKNCEIIRSFDNLTCLPIDTTF